MSDYFTNKEAAEFLRLAPKGRRGGSAVPSRRGERMFQGQASRYMRFNAPLNSVATSVAG